MPQTCVGSCCLDCFPCLDRLVDELSEVKHFVFFLLFVLSCVVSGFLRLPHVGVYIVMMMSIIKTMLQVSLHLRLHIRTLTSQSSYSFTLVGCHSVYVPFSVSFHPFVHLLLSIKHI